MSDYEDKFREQSKKAASKKKVTKKVVAKKKASKVAKPKKDAGKNKPAKAPSAKIIAETVLGEYIKMMLDTVREVDPDFNKKTEEQQKKVIDKCLPKAKARIGEIVKFFSGVDMKSTYGQVKGVSIKEKCVEVKLQLKLSDPHLHELVDFANEHIVITLANPEEYFEDVTLPEASSDQLPLNNFD